MVNNFLKILVICAFLFFVALDAKIHAQTPPPITETVSVSAIVPSNGNPSNGGGGGGVAVGSYPNTGVFLSGRGYPSSKINILKDGQLILSTTARPDSTFSAALGNLSSGNYTFSLYGIDKNGLHSSPFTFPIFINSGVTTSINSIFIAPTIAVDKSQVRQGDAVTISGQSASFVNVLISVNSSKEIFKSINTDASGMYSNSFDTSIMELGPHPTESKAIKLNEISPYSDIVNFIVGKNNILQNNSKKLVKCDLNDDNRCNLVDFSIAAFWYKRPLSPEFAKREKEHLGGRGIVDLIDFSIMAFYWTG